MTPKYVLVSRHFWRRTARWHERLLERTDPGNQYAVVKATRGPFAWWVVRRTNSTPTR